MTNSWKEIKEQILQSITIQDIIEKYTYNKIVDNRCKCFSCSGNQIRTMSLDKGYAYCFRCGNSYNQIQAVMKINGCDFMSACKTIISDFRLNIPLDRPLTVAEQKEALKRELERENENKKKKAREKFLREVNLKIIDKIRKCEKFLRVNDKKSIEFYNTHDLILRYIWICEKEIKRLDWIYETINELDRDKNCEYEYTMPTDSIELLREIYKNNIKI